MRMQTKQVIVTLIGLAVLLLFALAVISFVPRAQLIHAQSPRRRIIPNRTSDLTFSMTLCRQENI